MDRVTIDNQSFDLEKVRYLTCLTVDLEHFLFDQGFKLEMDKEFYFQRLTLMHWNNGDIDIPPYSSYGFNDFYVLFDPRCIIVNRPAAQFIFQRTNIPQGYGVGLRPYWRYTLFIKSKELMYRRQFVDFLTAHTNVHKLEYYYYDTDYVVKEARDTTPIKYVQNSLLDL